MATSQLHFISCKMETIFQPVPPLFDHSIPLFYFPSLPFSWAQAEIETEVLWLADEVQTGLGRTGKRLAVDHEDVR